MSLVSTAIQEEIERLDVMYASLNRSSKSWLVAGALGFAVQVFLIVKIAKTDFPK